MREGIYEQAEDGQWVKAEWCVARWPPRRRVPWISDTDVLFRFKLHLRSRVGPGSGVEVSSNIHPLPLNKTVVEVFADFLAYLFDCAASYITDTHPNGVDLWASVKGDIDFVLSHPNGWEGTQQSQMRRSAILAGLIPDTTAGNARLSFVTEGEASLHFAIQNGLPSGAMKVCKPSAFFWAELMGFAERRWRRHCRRWRRHNRCQLVPAEHNRS